MAEGAIRHVLTLVISPRELRALANQMELEWPKSGPGGDLVIRTLYFRHYRLEIAMDQGYFQDMERDNAAAS